MLEPLIIFGTWISGRVIKIETPLFLIALIAVLQDIRSESNFSIIVITALLLLSLTYFFSAYSKMPEEENDGYTAFFSKLLGFGSAMTIIGILFKIENWPGHKISMNSAIMMAGICLIVVVIQRVGRQKSIVINNTVVIRIIILAAITTLIFFLTNSELLELGIIEEIVNES